MDLPFSYQQLAIKISEVFTHQEDYQLAKHIQEFKNGDTYLGDFLVYFIFESHGENPPTFYTVNSPYDMVTKKAPQQALVFEDGKLIFNEDYTEYVTVRTGVMDGLLLKALQVKSLTDKKILYLGTGPVAQHSLKALKEIYPEIIQVDFNNRTKDSGKFGDIAKELDITIQYVDLSDVSTYDYIFCHTSSLDPVLTDDHFKQIKQGALITTYVTMGSENGEIIDAFYDNTQANIIMDWEQTPIMAKELKRAMDSGKANNVVVLNDVLNGNYKSNSNARYTLYRSVGTPMQNVALLKILLQK